MVVSLDRAPVSEESDSTGAAHAAMFAAVLRAALGDERPIRVSMTGTPPVWMHGPVHATGRFPMDGPPGPSGMHRFPPEGVSMLTQVRLQDGTWASFDTQLSQAAAGLPWRVLLTLAILLAAVLLLSYVAVRWVTRPLNVLATAADELGRDINRPPLPESGPLEVSRAAHAFNTMQASLVRFIDERTRLLTAMSHDLKTPITRMRLRTELLENDSLREKFEKDLLEMESMVTADARVHARCHPARARATGGRHGSARKPAGRQRSNGEECHDRRTYHASLLGRATAPQALHLQSDRQCHSSMASAPKSVSTKVFRN